MERLHRQNILLSPAISRTDSGESYAVDYQIDDYPIWLRRLCGKVSQATENHHVTYDFLTKALSRLLCLGTVDEIIKMLELSDAVKTRMKEKGLFTIQSLADVFPEDEKLFGYCGV